jgi:hypothetical protein
VEIDDSRDAADTGARDAGTDSPCYSLHAVAGVRLSDTLRVRVVVGAASLVALLDSGSSHNFISEQAARRTGLPVETALPATLLSGRWWSWQRQRLLGCRKRRTGRRWR